MPQLHSHIYTSPDLLIVMCERIYVDAFVLGTHVSVFILTYIHTYIHTCFDLSERSIMLNWDGQRLVRSTKVSLRSDTPDEAVGAAPGAEDTLLSSI